MKNIDDIIPPEGPGWYAVYPVEDGAVVLAEVTETPAGGRLCRALQQGGHAACGFGPWDGQYVPLKEMDMHVTVEENRILVHVSYDDQGTRSTWAYDTTPSAPGGLRFEVARCIRQGASWIRSRLLDRQITATGRRMNRVMLRRIERWVSVYLASRDYTSDERHLRFKEGPEENTVVPANLYTALRIWLGDMAPGPEECAGGRYVLDDEEEDGEVLYWRNDRLMVKQPSLVKNINISLTLTKHAYYQD